MTASDWIAITMLNMQKACNDNLLRMYYNILTIRICKGKLSTISEKNYNPHRSITAMVRV